MILEVDVTRVADYFGALLDIDRVCEVSFFIFILRIPLSHSEGVLDRVLRVSKPLLGRRSFETAIFIGSEHQVMRIFDRFGFVGIKPCY